MQQTVWKEMQALTRCFVSSFCHHHPTAKDHNGYHEGGLSAGNFVPADGEAFEGISMLYMTGNDGSLFF